VNPIESDDYIPLNTSGTTRFGVMPLDSNTLTPAGADFKEKMFMSPGTTRISVKKQQALKMKSKAGKLVRH